MTDLWIAVLLSIVAGVCYAGGAVGQRRVAERLGTPLTPRIVLTVLIRDRLWWSALLMNSAGAILHVVALAYGTLVVVQPLGLLSLVFALPWSARLAARQVSPREWRGAALTVFALTVLLVVAMDTDGTTALDHRGTITVAVATLTVVYSAALLGRVLTAAVRAPLLAVAAGTSYGVSSALTKALVDSVTADGLTGLLHPALPGIAVLALTGVLLSQAAYRGVTVGAPLSIMTVTNPIAAVTVGLTVMGESYMAGVWGIGVALVAALVAIRGITLLTVTVPDTTRVGGTDATTVAIRRTA
ncbi:DMT family transporter [Spiractinospora alimapuensis]|uniref:DMT family transporter n=1 Tax=Spiractinospora alimapuensis TaxID=2820884 RepID=UPI001F4317F5|nr:DMT family transporter [Spiractinospora alimapuensis]QVQ52560.1 DMT family transporter [Spiractinospora alimapuensis]